MADTKTEKTSAQMYEALIDQLRVSSAETSRMHTLRLDEFREKAREQETELKAQADGLLGAIGRINAENTDLKAKLQAVIVAGEHSSMEMKRQAFQMESEIHKLRQEKERIVDDAKRCVEEAVAKVVQLQDELAAATKGKK